MPPTSIIIRSDLRFKAFFFTRILFKNHFALSLFLKFLFLRKFGIPTTFITKADQTLVKKTSDLNNWSHFLLKKSVLKPFCSHTFFGILLYKKVRFFRPCPKKLPKIPFSLGLWILFKNQIKPRTQGVKFHSNREHAWSGLVWPGQRFLPGYSCQQ